MGIIVCVVFKKSYAIAKKNLRKLSLPIWYQSGFPASLRAASIAFRNAKKTDEDMQTGGSPVAIKKLYVKMFLIT